MVKLKKKIIKSKIRVRANRTRLPGAPGGGFFVRKRRIPDIGSGIMEV